MIVGKIIKEIRENAGLSQEQFAKKLAISRQAVSKWERGAALPDIENIMYISELFNVSLDTIVKGDEKMTKKIISDSKNAKLIIKLFISLGFALIVFVFTTYILRLDFFGNSWFLDLRAVLIVIISPLIFMGILYGFKNIRTSFSVISKNHDKKDLLCAKAFFEIYGITVFLTAFIASVLSFIALLKYQTREEFGPAIALIVISFLYAGIINLVIVIPYKIIIKKKINEIEN
jgi:transcriptional regulator with XRE-family HTH domain